MNLCANDHEEICYEGSKCPVCPLVQEIEEKNQQIGKLEDEINTLNKTIDELAPR